jgi:hypothetical protein
MQLLLDEQRRTSAKGKPEPEPEEDVAPPRKAAPASEPLGQGDLSLDNGGRPRGRFKDVEPTILDGQNVDIPTFIRRNMAI